MATTLGDICKVDWGNTALTKKSYVDDGVYLAVSATGADGRLNHYEHEADVCVLSAIGAQCGKMFFPEQRFTAIKNTITLTPNADVVFSKFLYYLITAIELPKRGAAQPFISKGDIENFEIPHFPALAEQQRIVAKLDAAFAEIDEAIRLANGKEEEVVWLSASLLSNSFKDNGLMWSNVKLKDVVNYEKVNAQGSSLPYLGMENISSETMQIVNELEVPESTSSTFKFDKTHVLYGRLRPYLKKVFVPNFEGQCSTEIFCLKPSPNLNRKFLAYWLLSPIVADKIENTSTGARMPRANMNAILEFDFFLPQPEEQQSIVAKLDSAFAEISIAKIALRRKKANYESLKSAILTQELQSEAV